MDQLPGYLKMERERPSVRGQASGVVIVLRAIVSLVAVAAIFLLILTVMYLLVALLILAGRCIFSTACNP